MPIVYYPTTGILHWKHTYMGIQPYLRTDMQTYYEYIHDIILFLITLVIICCHEANIVVSKIAFSVQWFYLTLRFFFSLSLNSKLNCIDLEDSKLEGWKLSKPWTYEFLKHKKMLCHQYLDSQNYNCINPPRDYIINIL